jgi:hypothetical protein
MVSNWLTTNYEDCVLKVSMHKGETDTCSGISFKITVEQRFQEKDGWKMVYRK